MDGKRFRVWQESNGWTGAETARRLGKSDDTISIYRKQGVPPRESRIVGLAMAALDNKLEPVK